MARYKGIVVLGFALWILAGCGTSWSAPAETAPAPAYVPMEGSAAEVWDAAVDYLVDTGTEWGFISNDMMTARMSSLITRGPIREGNRVRPSPDAAEYADCGVRNNNPGAGWGDLWAGVAIRVREGSDGEGLLKVVVPNMWLERPGQPDRSCVSTGTLEELIYSGILERVNPIISSQPESGVGPDG